MVTLFKGVTVVLYFHLFTMVGYPFKRDFSYMGRVYIYLLHCLINYM